MTPHDEAGPAPGSRSRQEKELAEAAFKALLARLGAEGERPEVTYERLRKRLITYFRLHVPAQADDLADLTLDRLARRILDGIFIQNVYLYALGIARLVVHEAQARLAREQTNLAQAVLLEHGPDTEEETETVLAALQSCLERIGRSGAELILQYYAGGEGSARIEKRRTLAVQLGLSLNALRNRALRLRDLLERCTREKLGWRDANSFRNTPDDSSEAPGP
jgi:DNA-directed RNA polymerase specialized sigma24 family protein